MRKLIIDGVTLEFDDDLELSVEGKKVSIKARPAAAPEPVHHYLWTAWGWPLWQSPFIGAPARPQPFGTATITNEAFPGATITCNQVPPATVGFVAPSGVVNINAGTMLKCDSKPFSANAFSQWSDNLARFEN